MLPEFYAKLDDVELVHTFKRQLVEQLQGTSNARIDAEAMFRELWGHGGCLSSMALKTTERAEMLATQPGGLIDQALLDITSSVVIAFLAPLHNEDCQALASAYEPPARLRACIDDFLRSRPSTWLTDTLVRRSFTTMFSNSLVLDQALEDAARDVWDDAAC